MEHFIEIHENCAKLRATCKFKTSQKVLIYGEALKNNPRA
jgi:hypothetical protein